MNNICIVFDLDDTLYKERDFLQSGYRYIATRLCKSPEDSLRLVEDMNRWREENKNVFKQLELKFDGSITVPQLLEWYRFHNPDIEIPNSSLAVLKFLRNKKIQMGIITDGRCVTQSNKIKALGIDQFIEDSNIVISENFGSEKPDLRNYQYFESLLPGINTFYYVGDNPAKDFIAPHRLGWRTIGILDEGSNIHKQTDVDNAVNPDVWVNDINEIPIIIQSRIE